MRILDKHIIKEFIYALILCLAVFLFLFVMIDSFTNLDDFIRNSVQAKIVFKYYLMIIPTIFIQTLPLACLLAMIYTMGNLNYNNELIAMRSGGLSIYKIALPIFIFGIMLCLLSFLISERIVPKTQQLSDSIKTKYIDRKSHSEEIIKNLAIYGFHNKQLFINVFNAKTNNLEGLTILEHDNKQNVISKVYVNKASWKDNAW